MEKLIKSLVDLLKVKSIITLLSFIAFVYLSIKGKIDVDNFMLILGMIATYFFSKAKKDEGGKIDEWKRNNRKRIKKTRQKHKFRRRNRIIIKVKYGL